MKNKSYNLYLKESDNWLYRNRKIFFYNLLRRHIFSKNNEILEIGAGAGQNIETLSYFGTVDAIEINPIGLNELHKVKNLRSILDKPIPTEINNYYDIICAFDVIEHIQDDKGAVSWIIEHLKGEGVAFFTVPAYQWLFSSHDISLGHCKRYTKSSFSCLLPEKIEILHAGYFNTFLFPLACFSRFAWQIKENFMHKGSSNKQAMPKNGILNDIFSFIFRFEIKLINRGYKLPFGLSLYFLIKKI